MYAERTKLMTKIDAKAVAKAIYLIGSPEQVKLGHNDYLESFVKLPL
jgi:hypothetical protein